MFHLGVSGKSVLLYALVFTCRYLDLFVHFISPYNTIMKVIYIVATYLTLYLIYRKFRVSYDRNHDAFRIELLIIPAAALSFIWNHELTPLEVNKTIEAEPVISIFFLLDSVDLLYLSRVGRRSASAVHGQSNRRSRDDYQSLSVCIGYLSISLHPQLDLSLLLGELHRLDLYCCGRCANGALL